MLSRLSPRLYADNLSFPLTRYLVAPEHRLLVCSIPKNGCSTLARWWLAAFDAGRPVPEILADVHTAVRERHVLSLAQPDVALHALATFRKIVFVREPLGRIASAFVDKFIGPADHERYDAMVEMLEHMGEPGRPAPDLTFRQFVNYLDLSIDEHLDLHLRPQAAFLGTTSFDEIVPFERMDRRLAALSAELSVPPPRVRRENQSVYTREPPGTCCDLPTREMHARWMHPRTSALIDPPIAALFRRRFARDFDLYARAVAGGPPAPAAAIPTP
jgi:hypothetical protein